MSRFFRTSSLRTNLCTNPVAGSGATTGWSSVSLATFSAVTLGAGGAPAAGGEVEALGITTGFKCKSTGNAQRAVMSIPVVSGVTYRLSQYVYLVSVGTGVDLASYNEALTQKADGSNLTVPLGSWQRTSTSITADATTTWTFASRGLGATANEWYFTGYMVEELATGGAAPSFFPAPGQVTLGQAVWTGTPDASTSTFTVPTTLLRANRSQA